MRIYHYIIFALTQKANGDQSSLLIFEINRQRFDTLCISYYKNGQILLFLENTTNKSLSFNGFDLIIQVKSIINVL